MSAAEHLESKLLSNAGFRHAFFTRRGGVSSGPFESLSFSVAVGDFPENVAENLRRAAGVLGVRAQQIYFASQVHGAVAELADGSVDREAFLQREADAVVSSVAGIACAVRTADCVPILVADRASGAVTAIHAGWRGVVARVVHAGIRRLRDELGCPGDLVAAIGPHISVAAFEVSTEVAEQLRSASMQREVVDTSAARPRVDLRAIVRAQLRENGLADDCIDDVAGCTVTDRDRFFSFRRDGKHSGRHLSAIVARGCHRRPRSGPLA